MQGQRYGFAIVALVSSILVGGSAVGAQSESQSVELFGAYNFMLEVSDTSRGTVVGGYFTECSGLGSESAVAEDGELEQGAPASASTMAKFTNLTLKRGTIATSDLDAWKARIQRSGLLVLSRRQGGRVLCRWELHSPQILGVRGVNVRDAAELTLRARVSGGCT